MGERRGDAEEVLETFAASRHEYAQYCIDSMPGSRGRHGSVNSESNHSSVLCYMNDGHKKTNEYCEDVITLVKDLLGRQNMHCIEMNRLLYEDEKLLMTECETLSQMAPTARSADLLRAARVLCRMEYEFYKRARRESLLELSLSVEADGTLAVNSNKPDIAPVFFQSREGRCVSCKDSTAMERQCKHEICLTGSRFEKARWLLRQKRRSRLSRSVTGWARLPLGAVPE